MTFIEVYPGQQFLSIRQNGAVDDGHLQKVAIGGIFKKKHLWKSYELTIVDRTISIPSRH